MNCPLFVVVFSYFFCSSFQSGIFRSRDKHSPNQLKPNQLKYLVELGNTTDLEETINKILIPRVVGTPNHDIVHEYIVDDLKKYGWDVQVDSFEARTPNFGELTFRNIIGTLNPNADRYLVLACHYDSKYFPDGDFLGATDSAVPCAMMLNLIHVMRNELENFKKNDGVSLKFIFFDGEEAFVNWGPTDSIYGAKHLAKKLELSKKRTSVGETTELDQIDVLVLLDLLGAENPKFYNFFQETERWHLRLANAENQLANMGHLKGLSNRRGNYFQRRTTPSYIEDDHIPFLQRGVRVLHLIPTPFPRVWHNFDDNREAIDITTTENLNKILRVFVSEYLHLSILDVPEDDEEEYGHKEL